MPDRPQRGLLDTSLIIGLERVDPDALPEQVAIPPITLAELAAGPHATSDTSEAARRQQRLQLAVATSSTCTLSTPPPPNSLPRLADHRSPSRARDARGDPIPDCGPRAG